tara:strand:- start:303 stop:563 length:261 start_codon:yes stop_codon:yes gene_type:complete
MGDVITFPLSLLLLFLLFAVSTSRADDYNSMYYVSPALLNDSSLLYPTSSDCEEDYHHSKGYDYQRCSFPLASQFLAFAIHGGKVS